MGTVKAVRGADGIAFARCCFLAVSLGEKPEIGASYRILAHIFRFSNVRGSYPKLCACKNPRHRGVPLFRA